MKTSDGRLIVIGGASRSGKTAWTRREVSKDQRIIAWDPEDQWSHEKGFTRITTRAGLLAAAKKAGPGKFAYVAGGDLKAEFNFFAGCAMYAGRYVEPITAIAEELADVTSQGKAPGNWGILLRRGLKRGINIYAISQRWAEADKTAMGNASEFLIFRQATGDDARYMARKTRVSEEEINSLKPLDYIRYDSGTGETLRSRLKF